MTFGGLPILDADTLAREMAAQGMASPWYTQANTFNLVPGRGPGRGAVLMKYDDYNRLNLRGDNTLTIIDASKHRLDFRRLTVTYATCVLASAPAERGRTTYLKGYEKPYLVEFADRRVNLARIPVDKAYNLIPMRSDGSAYYPATLVPPAFLLPWTWQQVVQDLWTVLGLGTAPSLPFTPHNRPENLNFYGGYAWEAINQIFDRLACTLMYNPLTDQFTFHRDGADVFAAAAANKALSNLTPKLWDGEPLDANRGRRPEKVRVLFRRVPIPSGGTSPWYAVDYTLPSIGTGLVVPGTVVTLRDDLVALAGVGTPANTAILAARAAERATDWLRKWTNRDRRLSLKLRDAEPSALVALSGAAASATWADRETGPNTDLVAGEDYSLENFDVRPDANTLPYHMRGIDGVVSGVLPVPADQPVIGRAPFLVPNTAGQHMGFGNKVLYMGAMIHSPNGFDPSYNPSNAGEFGQIDIGYPYVADLPLAANGYPGFAIHVPTYGTYTVNSGAAGRWLNGTYYGIFVAPAPTQLPFLFNDPYLDHSCGFQVISAPFPADNKPGGVFSNAGLVTEAKPNNAAWMRAELYPLERATYSVCFAVVGRKLSGGLERWTGVWLDDAPTGLQFRGGLCVGRLAGSPPPPVAPPTTPPTVPPIPGIPVPPVPPITTISITGTFGRPDAYQFAPLPGAGDGYTVPAAPPGVGALSPGQMDTYQQQRRRGPLLCWDDNGDPQEIRVDGAGAVYTSPVTPP